MTLQELFHDAIMHTEILRKGESKYDGHYVFLVKVNEGIEYYYQVCITDATGGHIMQSVDIYDKLEGAEGEYREHLKREKEQPLNEEGRR